MSLLRLITRTLGSWLCSGITLVIFGSLHPAAAAPTTTATYTVTFDSFWSANSHPQDFPPNAHFSSLIGGAHHADVVFWQPDAPASRGIKDVAELGSPGQLRAEIEDAIEMGTTRAVIAGPGTSSPGSARTSFTIQPSHPFVTLVTMIAPSPDWFVGVHGLSLVQKGRWAEEVVVSLWPYDAGTDRGVRLCIGLNPRGYEMHKRGTYKPSRFEKP